MQAMHIYLASNQDILLDRGVNVQGLNYPTDRENSFDSFLQKQLNEDTLRAKEGPPEHRNGDSNATTSPNGEQGSSRVNENTQSDSQKNEKSDSTSDDQSVKQKDSDVSNEKAHAEKKEASEKLAKQKEELENADQANNQSSIMTQLTDNTQLNASLDTQQGTIEQNDLSGFQVLEGTDSLKKLPASDSNKKVLQEIPTINVLDERSVTSEGKSEGNFVHSITYDGNGNATLDMSLNQNLTGVQNPNGLIVNADGSVQQHTVSNAQHFGTMLSSELQSNSSELVKTGSIILRDGNQGSINLILHPEELGNVKIRLEISDNVLSGRITVASEEAYNAFKANLGSLKEAFDASGFDTAGFDLTWSGDENQGQEQDQESTSQNPYWNRYDENIAVLNDVELQSVLQQAYVDVIV